MDERLDLHVRRNIFPDLPDLRQGKFPGRYHSLRPLGMPELVCQIVGVVGLSAHMNVNLRADFPGQHESAGIRNDERIRLQLF